MLAPVTPPAYEALYECQSAVTLSEGKKVRPGDLARESELHEAESRLVAAGKLRLVGYVRRGARMG
jgi:hypothetical protein